MGKRIRHKFPDEKYLIEQRVVLNELQGKHSSVDWKMYLSPYHSHLIYEDLIEEEWASDYDAYSGLMESIGSYGNITVLLDWILGVWSKKYKVSQREAYFSLREKYEKDGDALGEVLCRKLEYTQMPIHTRVMRIEEYDYGQYILRDNVPEDGFEWCCKYIGKRREQVHIVEVWNKYKSNYEHYLREQEYELKPEDDN